MARSFANAKVLSAIILDGLSNTITRRGYAAATESTTRGGVMSVGNKMGPTKTGEDGASSTYKVSWVPDPVTGYYKPENIKDTDAAADLRAKLLRKKFNN